MITETRKLINSSVNHENISDFHLSIQISLDGFSFCIFDQVKSCYLAIYQYTFTVNAHTPEKLYEYISLLFIKNHWLKTKGYKKIHVSHCNNLTTFVPKSFFTKKNLKDYLKYNVKVYKNDYITYDLLEPYNIVNVYIPFVNINNFLFDQFGSFNFKHESFVLVSSLLSHCKNLENTFFFVHVMNSSFEIVIIRDKKLELYNSFKYKNKKDFVYYILYTAEQLQLNPEEFPLVLSGLIEPISETYQIVFQYVRHVSFITPEKLSLPESFLQECSFHSFYTLLNQHLCE